MYPDMMGTTVQNQRIHVWLYFVTLKTVEVVVGILLLVVVVVLVVVIDVVVVVVIVVV